MFKDLNIQSEYRSGKNNVIKDFFIPVLSNAVKYKRAVGFFSSSALVEIAKGITGLLSNGGQIELIVSPRLSEEDIIAIEKGYGERDKIIETALMREFFEPKTYFESERLNILATLIAEGRLDIKVAFTTKCNQIGIYHEKMGLMYDKEGNVIAFSGSTNETEMAFVANYEVMDVFCSWQTEFEQKKVYEKELAFHRLWTNADNDVNIIEFPDVAKEKLQTYKKDVIDKEIDLKETIKIDEELEKNSNPKNAFRVPNGITFYNYQQKAIDNWMRAENIGIFDMATGSGKTFTGLGALAALSEKRGDHLGVIIICPYQHLVEQWVEDIRRFNVEPLICYSKYDWKKRFNYLIKDYKLGVIERFCAIMTNATYSTDYVQDILKKSKDDLCILVDEAHNFGAEKLQQCMLNVFKYRLALSATIERHNDEAGTEKLMEYFGEKCIEFTLKDAIDNDFLTHYYYKPVVVYLEDEELEEYNKLTNKIGNILKNNPDKETLPKSAEVLLLKRARLIAGAKNKLSALKEQILPYKDESYLLVYCGATKYDDDNVDEGDKRQIEAVTEMLGNELNMRVSMFTSKESPDERERIKNSFAEGKMLQAIVAIKCLDEGVNIPGIRTAFILASSTNPKEYIQRRGRVLRKAKGKDHATIYDFVTLPKPLGSPLGLNVESELTLIRREMQRVEDFMDYCDNKSETIKLLDEIKRHYKLFEIGVKDYGI